MCCCLFLCWCWTSGQQQPKKISFSFFFSLFFLVFDFFFCFFSLFLSLLFSFFSFFFFLPSWVYYILFFSRFHPDFFPTFSRLFPIASLSPKMQAFSGTPSLYPKNTSIFGDPVCAAGFGCTCARASLTARVHHRYKNPRTCRGFLLFSHFIPDFFQSLRSPQKCKHFRGPRLYTPKIQVFSGTPYARRVLDARALAPRSPLACIIGIKIHAHVADFYCFLILFPFFSIYYLLSIIYYPLSLISFSYRLSLIQTKRANSVRSFFVICLHPTGSPAQIVIADLVGLATVIAVYIVGAEISALNHYIINRA